jgi:hypothetical protein
LSIDPAVAETNQPYVFTNDDPLNTSDSLGLIPSMGLSETDAQLKQVATTYLRFEGSQDEVQALNYLKEASKRAGKENRIIRQDLIALAYFNNGDPTPKVFVKSLNRAFSSLLGPLQYAANFAYAGYKYLAGTRATVNLVDTAGSLDELAAGLEGTLEGEIIASASTELWTAAGAAAADDAYNLLDVFLALGDAG